MTQMQKERVTVTAIWVTVVATGLLWWAMAVLAAARIVGAL